MSATANSLSKIEPIVVLMLENRSFDNLLGWLYDPQNDPPFNVVPADFEGLCDKNLSNRMPDPYGRVDHSAHGSRPYRKATLLSSRSDRRRISLHYSFEVSRRQTESDHRLAKSCTPWCGALRRSARASRPHRQHRQRTGSRFAARRTRSKVSEDQNRQRWAVIPAERKG
jgi:hypothetical protein